jgi:hypothetical protein
MMTTGFPELEFAYPLLSNFLINSSLNRYHCRPILNYHPNLGVRHQWKSFGIVGELTLQKKLAFTSQSDTCISSQRIALELKWHHFSHHDHQGKSRSSWH